MNKATNVSTGKPKITGAIYAAILNDGLVLPITAKSELSEGFKCLGYISDAGVTNTDTRSTSDIKAWGGNVVKSTITEHADKLKYKLIECLSVEVLKHVYGSSNVAGTLETGIVIKSNAAEKERIAIVIDMILNESILKRIVAPIAQVTEVADIVYKDDEAIGYDTTASLYPDASGNTHYEYIEDGAEPDTVNVIYDANTGTGTMDNSVGTAGEAITVKECTFTPPDSQTFSKWNTEADGSGTDYDPDDTITANADTTLYAIWA